MSAAVPSLFESEMALYQVEKIALNKQQLSKAVTFGAIVGGCTAGLLGLEGMYGFGCYFVFYLLVLTILSFRLRMMPWKYFRSVSDLTAASLIVEGLTTFILVWTIAYASIYIF